MIPGNFSEVAWSQVAGSGWGHEGLGQGPLDGCSTKCAGTKELLITHWTIDFAAGYTYTAYTYMYS